MSDNNTEQEQDDKPEKPPVYRIESLEDFFDIPESRLGGRR